MQFIQKLIYAISLVLLSVTFSEAKSMGEPKVSEYRYFRGFYTNYAHPFGVKQEISKEEAKKLKAYIVANFDESENIVNIIKIFDNKCEFWFIYKYDKKGKFLNYKKGICSEWKDG